VSTRPGPASRSLRCHAPGKINLGLRVVGRRADGYHELVSLFAPLDLGDEVEVAVSESTSLEVEIELEGESLDSRGMVTDFGQIKSVMKKWIDENLDHRMILRQDDPAVAFVKEHGEPCFLVAENPTAETIARVIFEEARKQGFPVVSVVLWETPDSCATYTGA